mmetsp:Transcript_30012/g.55716  ORF Transcript_30012/g.55716 Transcript_30012/m.55716 type:complete len:305 (-) Transcript_30012:271-1185(-)
MSQRRVIVGVQQGVFDEAGLAREDRARRHAAARQRHGLAPLPGEGRILIVATEGSQLQHAPVQAEQQGPVGLAQVARQRHDAVEHGLHVGRRAADHLQHLRAGGLLLQCLLGLVKEARVLNRDHGLRSKCLQQFDLSGRQQTWLLVGHTDQPEHLAFTEQRGVDHGAVAAQLGERTIIRIARIGLHIADLRHHSQANAIDQVRRVDAHAGRGLQDLQHLLAGLCGCNGLEPVPLHAEQRRRKTMQQPAGTVHDGREHGLDGIRRSGNDLEDLRRGRLPLQRLLRLRDETGVFQRHHSARSDRFE